MLEGIGRCQVLVVSAICQILWGTVALCDSTDVFPLRNGLSYMYQYEAGGSSWNYGQYSSSRDSGTLAYTIIDSASLNDSTILWMVREEREATLWYSDTVIAISETTIVRLLETTLGYHELQCSSAVWNFPITFDYDQSYPVFRYSDSSYASSVFAGSFCPCCPDGNHDSLWFASDSGLFARSTARCLDLDYTGWRSWGTFQLLSVTVVFTEEEYLLPTGVKLHVNYPNPFNPTTTIEYELPEASYTLLTIYDLLGRQVELLTQGFQGAGLHRQVFDGSGLNSGVYFLRLQTSGMTQTIKMMLLK